ncbi:MAG: UPF0228 family protein, partial [Euryarchaeota archaeon]|nr:UPF0228 family protein [Euryarchaeota archaeon]
RFGDKKKATVDVDYNASKRIEGDLEKYNKVLIANFDYSPYTINEHEIIAGGLFVWFEEGVTEPEVRQILGNHDLGTGYKLEYDVDWMGDCYYLMIEKDETLAFKDDLQGVENWVESGPDIAKGDHYIITICEPVIVDKEFLTILDDHDLQLKQSIGCYARFDGRIDHSTAKELEKELEENEKILFVYIDDVEGSKRN